MAPRVMRCIGFVMILWAFVLLYMGMNLYQLVEESRKSTQELLHVRSDLVKLKEENIQLRNENIKQIKKLNEDNIIRTSRSFETANTNKNLLEKLRLSNKKLKNLQDEYLKAKDSDSKLSINREKLRRRISNQLQEMWFSVSGHVKILERMVSEAGRQDFHKFLDTFRELQQITELDFNEFFSMDGAQNIRDKLADELSNIVQKRLYNLQHPENCDSARKLVCSLNKGCGYGCQMHHILYCFIVAYSTKRTMIIDSHGWRYSSRGWEAYFQPISNSCVTSPHGVEWSLNHEKNLVIHLPIVDSLFPRPKQMPLAVPLDLYDRIPLFHGHPFVWWIGQFCKYLFKFQPDLKAEIEAKKKDLKFERPIVGVQIRRTDKINLEAAFHEVDEYMHWVDLYYKKLALKQSIERKLVFIATDDPSVLAQAREKYPDYLFISDNDVSKSARLSSRYSDESLRGVISDIELLSDTDFLVCTFSSQVCRLAYEIMNSKHTDASDRFRSLDDVYYFGGQQEHKMKAIWPHSAKGRSEISLEIGDLIGIAGNHWNGQAKGLHHNSQKSGLFPAYKVEDFHDTAAFPHYQDE